MEIHACQRSSALHPLETYDLASGFMCAVLLESNTTANTKEFKLGATRSF
jgi:hypothetical protein